MQLRVSGDVALGQTLAIAWRDLAGAGLRALSALEPGEGCSASSLDVEIDGLSGAEPKAQLVNFVCDADGCVRTSLLLLLASPSEEEQTSLAAAVHEFASPCGRVVLLAAMRFPAVLDCDDGVRALVFNGASSNRRPGFPADTVVPDGLLAALLHFSRAGGTPTLALLAPGFRTRCVTGDAEALEVARTLAAAACGTLDCAFAPERLSAVDAPLAGFADTSLVYT